MFSSRLINLSIKIYQAFACKLRDLRCDVKYDIKIVFLKASQQRSSAPSKQIYYIKHDVFNLILYIKIILFVLNLLKYFVKTIWHKTITELFSIKYKLWFLKYRSNASTRSCVYSKQIDWYSNCCFACMYILFITRNL